MKPGKLTLEPFTEGDSWDGIPAFTLTVNGVPPASPIDTVTMRFKKSGSQPSEIITLSSADDEITIVDAAGWEIEVPQQIVAGLTYGKWDWRIRITDDEGVIKTYVADTIEILETV